MLQNKWMYPLTDLSFIIILRIMHGLHATFKMEDDDMNGDLFSEKNEKYLPDLPNDKS